MQPGSKTVIATISLGFCKNLDTGADAPRKICSGFVSLQAHLVKAFCLPPKACHSSGQLQVYRALSIRSCFFAEGGSIILSVGLRVARNG